MNWQRSLVLSTATVKDALSTIDQGGLQIALIVDGDSRLIGTITDGDIRRGILRSVPLTAPVSKVMNPQPCHGDPSLSRQDILTRMRAHRVRHLPLLDAERKVIGLATFDDIPETISTHPNAVVLVAGGAGSRLRPLTDHTPKPLLKVGDKPLIDLIIERFASQGFRKFFLAVNYKAAMFEAHCGDGSRWGVSITYIHETQPLGTAGSLGLITDPIDKPVLVMNADVLTKIDFRQMLAFHNEHNAAATMAVREYGFQVPFGVVQVEGTQILGIEEKPEKLFFISAGIYILSPDALRQIPRQAHLDMPQLFKRLIEGRHQTAAYPVCEYWVDVGRHDDLARANAEYDEYFR